jgi:hypothetical protein
LEEEVKSGGVELGDWRLEIEELYRVEGEVNG